jgi:hypothetical protein
MIKRALPQRSDKTCFFYHLPQLQKLLPTADRFHNPSPRVCCQLLLQQARAKAESATTKSGATSVQSQAAWSCQAANHIMIILDTILETKKGSMMSKSTSGDVVQENIHCNSAKHDHHVYRPKSNHHGHDSAREDQNCQRSNESACTIRKSPSSI